MVAALCFGFFLLGLALGAFGRSWLRDRSLEAANRKMKRGGVMQPARPAVARVEPITRLDPVASRSRGGTRPSPDRAPDEPEPDPTPEADPLDDLLAPAPLRLPERTQAEAFEPEPAPALKLRSSLSFRPPA